MSNTALIRIPSGEAALKPAAVYCRVSGKNQANIEDGGKADGFSEDKFSIPQQKDSCLVKARELGAYVDDESIFVEVHTAAQFFERPKLTELRDRIKAKTYKYVIIHCVDRINRDIGHLAILVDECKRAGCELVSVLDKIDDTPEGKLMLFIKGYQAQAERENIRRRIMNGKKGRVLSGKLHSGAVEKFGWVRDKERGIRKIQPEQAKVVRLIYDLRIKNRMGFNAIARYLNDHGYGSPASWHKSQKEKTPLWHQKTVREMLSDSEYKGEAVVWRLQTVGIGTEAKIVKRDASEHIRMPDGTVEPIISPEIWEMAQQVTAQYRPRADAQIEKAPALIGGMAFCGYCKERMYRKGRGTSKHPLSYKCNANSHRIQSDIPRCNGRSLVATQAEATVWKFVKRILTKPDVIKRAIQNQSLVDPTQRIAEDMDSVKTQIDKITKEEARYIGRLKVVSDDMVGLIDKELAMLAKRKKALNVELQKLVQAYSIKKATVLDYTLMLNWLDTVAKDIDSVDIEGRIRLLHILDTRVFIDGPDNIKIEMKFDPSKARFLEEYVTVYQSESSEKAKGSDEAPTFLAPTFRHPGVPAQTSKTVLP